MIFVFHPTHHQVRKSSQNTKIMELGFAPTIPRSNPFRLKLFPHEFGGICEDLVQPVFQNHDFRFSPHTPPSHKIKPKHPKSWNLAMHQPCQDQFLLLPIFSHITLEAFVRFESSQFCKTMIYGFLPSHHQVTKTSQLTKLG